MRRANGPRFACARSAVETGASELDADDAAAGAGGCADRPGRDAALAGARRDAAAAAGFDARTD
jgi:hypothetical protein